MGGGGGASAEGVAAQDEHPRPHAPLHTRPSHIGRANPKGIRSAGGSAWHHRIVSAGVRLRVRGPSAVLPGVRIDDPPPCALPCLACLSLPVRPPTSVAGHGRWTAEHSQKVCTAANPCCVESPDSFLSVSLSLTLPPFLRTTDAPSSLRTGTTRARPRAYPLEHFQTRSTHRAWPADVAWPICCRSSCSPCSARSTSHFCLLLLLLLACAVRIFTSIATNHPQRRLHSRPVASF